MQHATTPSLSSLDDEAPTTRGARLVTTAGQPLPLRHTSLQADARGGIARVVLTQHFVNPLAEATHVTYLLPLPADAAVAGFAFTVADRRTVGTIAKRADARARFEQALLEGHTAALLEEERSSVFTEELGNVPPHAEVSVEIALDQPLRWLEESAWEWRFPTVVSPRYGSDLPLDVTESVAGASAEVALRIADAYARVESSSHAIVTGTGRVALAESAALDRDLVVAWHVRASEVGASLATTELGDDTFGLLTLVPPEAAPAPIARDLVVLIDASGSMSGAPLAQAVRAVSMLVTTLGDRDRLELVAFASSPRPATTEPMWCVPEAKQRALAWLSSLRASGGTEMRAAILAALAPLREDAQRQVVLVTDGHVGFERDVVADILALLPRSTRLHTIGVGSAVNRTLTRGAARAGGGVEILLGVDEDVERAVHRLRVRTSAPLVTNVTVSGDVEETASTLLPDLHAGCPALIPVRLRRGARRITVRGTTARGPFERAITPDAGVGPRAIANLFARERVDDLETRLAARDHAPALDAEITQLGLLFSIVTRHTSFVAVSEAQTVTPGTEAQHLAQPHAVAYGTSIAGVGLRSALSTATRGGGTVRFASDAGVTSDARARALIRRMHAEAIDRPRQERSSVMRRRELVRGPKDTRTGVTPAPRALARVRLDGPLTVTALAEAMSVPVNHVLLTAMNLGASPKGPRAVLDVETASRVARARGHLVERRLGLAEVRAADTAHVTAGVLARAGRFRLLRAKAVVWTGSGMLHRADAEVDEVASGLDCRVVLEGHADVRAGDTIECFVEEG